MALSILMALCYVTIYHNNFLFGGLLKVIILYCHRKAATPYLPGSILCTVVVLLSRSRVGEVEGHIEAPENTIM